MKNNVALIKKCTGCGCCANICPTKAINIAENHRGFFERVINSRKCINCGMCLKLCPQSDTKIDLISITKTKSWNYQTSDPNLINCVTSGGFASDAANYLINNNYLVIGTMLDYKKMIAVSTICTSNNDISFISGSKYLQSDYSNIYQNLLLDDSRKCIIGLPCQIAGIKAYLVYKKANLDNFIFIEVFCFGVPSYKLFRRYLSKETQNKDISSINFRSKKYGYHNYTFEIIFKDGSVKYSDQIFDNNSFYAFYKSRLFLHNSCYDCKYREKSSADIRLGDVWGDTRFTNDLKGLTAIYSLTNRGDYLIQSMMNNGFKFGDGNTELLSKQYSKKTTKTTHFFWYFCLNLGIDFAMFILKIRTKLLGEKND